MCLYSHALQVLDSQKFDELYGVLSVHTGFFGLTSATNSVPETNYMPFCMALTCSSERRFGELISHCIGIMKTLVKTK
jgi:hypothetical protein